MRATIEMIAERAGVSRGTVDRVIHNRSGVGQKSRERVLKAMEDLDYKMNEAASALAYMRNSRRIGMLLPDWQGFFHVEVMSGISAAKTDLQNYGIELVVKIYDAESPRACLEALEALVGEQVDGFCICAKNQLEIRQRLREMTEEGFPIITYNSDIPSSGRLCFVGQNLFRSGRVAAEIMTKCIREEEMVLVAAGNLEYDAHRQRVQGFMEHMQERGVGDARMKLIETGNDYQLTKGLVEKMVQDHPAIRGIYMANESVAGCVDALRHMQKAERIHVICHDLSQSTKEFLQQGSVDFVIGQDIRQQAIQSLNIMRGLLLRQEQPTQADCYVPITILNAESLFDIK